MAPSSRSNYSVHHGLKVAITVVCIVLLTILLPKSVNSLPHSSHRNENEDDLQQRKMVLGSRPPGCETKCLNCRPCIATLVIPVHKTKRFSLSSHGEDDSYYLLSWKCRCGNKLFQP